MIEDKNDKCIQSPHLIGNLDHCVMYVAKDLTFWIEKKSYHCESKVTSAGKDFIPLTPPVLEWFKTRVFKAEAACNGGKLSLEAFTRIVQAFCPVYEFAVRVGMIPDPVRKS